jgi:hypothetical protein
MQHATLLDVANSFNQAIEPFAEQSRRFIDSKLQVAIDQDMIAVQQAIFKNGNKSPEEWMPDLISQQREYFNSLAKDPTATPNTPYTGADGKLPTQVYDGGNAAVKNLIKMSPYYQRRVKELGSEMSQRLGETLSMKALQYRREEERIGSDNNLNNIEQSNFDVDEKTRMTAAELTAAGDSGAYTQGEMNQRQITAAHSLLQQGYSGQLTGITKVGQIDDALKKFDTEGKRDQILTSLGFDPAKAAGNGQYDGLRDKIRDGAIQQLQKQHYEELSAAQGNFEALLSAGDTQGAIDFGERWTERKNTYFKGDNLSPTQINNAGNFFNVSHLKVAEGGGGGGAGSGTGAVQALIEVTPEAVVRAVFTGEKLGAWDTSTIKTAWNQYLKNAKEALKLRYPDKSEAAIDSEWDNKYQPELLKKLGDAVTSQMPADMKAEMKKFNDFVASGLPSSEADNKKNPWRAANQKRNKWSSDEQAAFAQSASKFLEDILFDGGVKDVKELKKRVNAFVEESVGNTITLSANPSFTELAAFSQTAQKATDAAFTSRYAPDEVHFADPTGTTQKTAEKVRELERGEVSSILGVKAEDIEVSWMKDEKGTDVVPKGVFKIQGREGNFKVEYDKAKQTVNIMKQDEDGGKWKQEKSRKVDRKEWSFLEKMLRPHDIEGNLEAMYGGAP